MGNFCICCERVCEGENDVCETCMTGKCEYCSPDPMELDNKPVTHGLPVVTEPSLWERVTFGEMGLNIKGRLLLEEWAEVGKVLFNMDKCVQFWLGDWCNYGEVSYGDKYTQAMDETQYSYQTLRNYAWVARSIPVDEREPDLSFSHHVLVANFDSQKRSEILQCAKDANMTVSELKRFIVHTDIKQCDADHEDKSIMVREVYYKCPHCNYRRKESDSVL